jgi:hypothetical protein
MKGMKTVYKVLLVNGSCLAGFVIAAMANPDASVLVFGISCLVALVLINGIFFFRPWLRRRRGQPEQSIPRPQTKSEANFWLAYSLLLLLVCLLLGWINRHGLW